jgi:hypothetical protein
LLAKKGTEMSKKMYIIGDGEDFYTGFPADQPFNENGFPPFTSLKEARKALIAWNKNLGCSAENDCPSPLEIYELKKIK